MDKLIDLNVSFKGAILFALGFVIAGFASEYAVILGILGGVVAGFIAKGWKTKELPKSNSDEVALIRSVQKIRDRFVKFGADGESSDDSEADDDSEDEREAAAEWSALKKTKPRPEMGWFGVKYTRKSRW